MDRDSFYYAISEEEYNQLQQVYGWFPTNDITLVVIGLPKKTTKSLYENYTLWLFKLENERRKMIALTSKTYILDTDLGQF